MAEMTKPIDTAAPDRAAKLIQDAQRGKFDRALGFVKAWKNTHSLKEIARKKIITTGLKFGTNTGSAAIVALIGAGTIGTIASFGLAPALGIVVGALANKIFDAICYSQGSAKLALATKDNKSFGFELLVPGIDKVTTKYDRVKTLVKIRKQKGFLGALKSLYQKTRHFKTNIERNKKKKEGKKINYQHTFIKGDMALDQRLLELQFYAQMTFNVVGNLIDNTLKAREQYVQVMEKLHAYTIIQVHAEGIHWACKQGKCYSKSTQGQQYEKITEEAINKFIEKQALISHTQKGVDSKMVLQRLESLANSDSIYNPSNTEQAKGWVDSQKQDLGIAGGQAGVLHPLTVGEKNTQNLKEIGINTGMERGADLIAVDFLNDTLTNRMKSRKILKTTNPALGLVESITDDEFKSRSKLYTELIVKDKKALKENAHRTAQKIIHYVKKIDEIDGLFIKYVLSRIDNSISNGEYLFESCEDAWNVNRIANYTFSNYNKFITHLVYMEAILLQFDKKVSERINGITQGTIVKEGREIPKPSHLIARHNSGKQGEIMGAGGEIPKEILEVIQDDTINLDDIITPEMREIWEKEDDG